MYSDENIYIFGNKKNTIKTNKINEIFENIIKVITLIITIIIVILIIYLIWLQKRVDFLKNNENKMQQIEEKNIGENIDKNNDIVDTRNISKEIIEFDESLKALEEKEIFEFRTLNSKNILFERDIYKKSDNPDVTVILLIKNQAHCLHKALRSIQNQSLKNIEILVLVDCSYDNSTEIIEKYMKEDERIIMFNHDTIEGTMKIRAKGIKLAKGKYITQIDGDDGFAHKDVLYNSLYIANLGNLDIVEFYASEYRKGKFKEYNHLHKNQSGIVYQPELRTKYIEIRDSDLYRPIRCRNIWGKLIKKEVFIKTIDNIGSKYTDDYIVTFEDTIIRLSLFEVAQSYYLIKKQPGYYYSRDEKSTHNPFMKEKKCKVRKNVIEGLDPIKYLEYLMEKFNDNELEKKAIYHEILSIKEYEYKAFCKYLVGHYDMIYNILDKIVQSQYLTEKEKQKIIDFKNEIKKEEEKQKK